MDPVLDLTPTATETPVLETGDPIYVTFWRPFAMPGMPNNGSWEFISARFIHAMTKKVCFVLDSPHYPAFMGDGDTPEGSCVRFIAPQFVFADYDAARTFTKTQRPPGL